MMRTTFGARGLGGTLAVALAAVAVGAAPAVADFRDCGQSGCVMLVEVDGLEPGDVTQVGTPFLWALAHPESAGQTDVQGQLFNALLQGRNGFMWQAGRSPMTAATAPASASLLTAANPDQHGILADEFKFSASPLTPPQAHRLRPAPEDDAGGGDAPPLSSNASTLLELTTNAGIGDDPETWAFIGNPALATMLDGQLEQIEAAWSPTSDSGSDPALCPLPRRTPAAGGETEGEAEGTPQRACPSRDATTLQQAFSQLSDNPANKTPLFTYIHLAELGRTKQLHGDAEVADALESLDTALAAFVEGLVTHPETGPAFDRTFLMVTGNHGYEPTPPDRRVPDPDNVDEPAYDFSDFVADALPAPGAELVPQGTIATVYAPQATPEDLTALAATIEERGNEGCQELAGEDCIEEVVPVAALADLHETWALNPLTEEGVATGAGGQLVVTAKEGWAFGRATQRPNQDDPSQEPEADATNPYPGSSGGPRNRAIAVMVNGPDTSAGLEHAIRQGPSGGLPPTTAAQSPPNCTTHGAKPPADRNDPAAMADDIAATGHECQPETVDIALSIAGMLELDTGGVPIAPQARFLNEAFTPPLGVQEVVEEPQPELVQPEPPPPPAPIVITRGSVQVVTPPPPKDPFPYRGLVRRLRVRVTDATGRTFQMARRGATLSTIQVQGDFGKELSRVTLTFYKRAGGGRRARLAAIARFKPFVVKRGPVRLRLRIPKRFRPTHLGVAVQEIRSPENGGQPVGRPGGGIAQIADARRLHLRKGAPRPRRLRG